MTKPVKRKDFFDVVPNSSNNELLSAVAEHIGDCNEEHIRYAQAWMSSHDIQKAAAYIGKTVEEILEDKDFVAKAMKVVEVFRTYPQIGNYMLVQRLFPLALEAAENILRNGNENAQVKIVSSLLRTLVETPMNAHQQQNISAQIDHNVNIAERIAQKYQPIISAIDPLALANDTEVKLITSDEAQVIEAEFIELDQE